MKALLFLGSWIPLVALAGPFEDLVDVHNSGAPLTTVMTEDQAARWEKMFTAGRGTARIRAPQWSEQRPQGLAWWDWSRGEQTQRGWLALQTDASGKINAFYYTEKERPTVRINNALAGQAADSATTVIGLSRGFVEANPILSGLSGPAIAGVKIGVTLAVQEYAGLRYCTATSTSLAAVGWGAGAWNLPLLAHPATALIPAVAGVYLHHTSEPLWECLPNDIRVSRVDRQERTAGR